MYGQDEFAGGMVGWEGLGSALEAEGERRKLRGDKRVDLVSCQCFLTDPYPPGSFKSKKKQEDNDARVLNLDPGPPLPTPHAVMQLLRSRRWRLTFGIHPSRAAPDQSQSPLAMSPASSSFWPYMAARGAGQRGPRFRHGHPSAWRQVAVDESTLLVPPFIHLHM